MKSVEKLQSTKKKKFQSKSCILLSCPLNDAKYNEINQEMHSLFKIPGENRIELRKDWLASLKINEQFLKQYNRKDNYVCDRHFLASDFATTTLKRSAIPTQNIGYHLMSTQLFKPVEIIQSTPDVYEFQEDIVVEFNDDFNDNIQDNDDVPSLVIDSCKSSIFDQQSTSDTHTVDTEFPACTQFCVASATNEQFYRRQCEKLKEKSNIDERLICSLIAEKEALKLKYCEKKETIIKSNEFKKSIIKSYVKQNKRLRCSLSLMKTKLNKLYKLNKQTIFHKVDLLNYLNDNQKSFCKLILKQKFRFTDSDKFVAQNIYYRSPSLYRYLKNSLEIKLPSIPTILAWSKIKFIEPGINEDVVKIIREKISKMGARDRNAILVFDEINIKKSFIFNECTGKIDGLVYDEINIKKSFVFNDSTGKIDGLVQIENERKPHAASQAGFFMIRGIFLNWRIPFVYYLTKNSIKGSELKELILYYVSYCKLKLGITIKATVADQGSGNQSAYKLLGVTRDNPSFKDREGDEVYALYDYPHLIKSIRNTLLKTHISFIDKDYEEKQEASFQIIHAIYHEEENFFCKKLSKLTRAHVYPNAFEKMRVKFAVQVLSNTTAAAIRSICDEDQNLFIRKNISKFAIPTAKFCEMFNRCFDSLNKFPIFNKLKQGATTNDLDAHNFLKNEMLNFLSSLEYNTDAKCIDGLIQTIKAILSIAEFYFKIDNDISFIKSSHLNQDPLENFFGKLRAAGGFNRHPNAYQIGNVFAKIFCLKLVFNTQNSNCETDEENMLDNDWEILLNDIKTEHDENYIEEDPKVAESEKFEEEEESIEFVELDEVAELEDQEANFFTGVPTSLDENSLRYLLGFCCKKIIGCEICSQLLLKKKCDLIMPTENFILRKNYNFKNQLHLRAPADSLFEESKLWAKCFEVQFFNEPQAHNIKNKIIEKIHQNSTYAQTPNHENCHDSILKYFILILIRYNCNKGFEMLNKKLLQKEFDAKVKTKEKEKAAKKLKKKNVAKKTKRNFNKNSKGHQKLKLLKK